jgi:hypothetical protein
LTGVGDCLASPADGAVRLSPRQIWALRRFWLDSLRRGRPTARRPRYKNLFPELDAVFVHIPKTAGTSVHELFSQVSTSVSVADPERRAELTSVRSKGITKHSKAVEYVDRMGRTSWSSAFTFTFVRNPWDLMVSSYVWWLQKAPVYPHLRPLAATVAQLGDFEAFLRHRIGRICINEFVGNPSEWFMADGEDLVSYVGRVEELADDIGTILDHLGIERAARPELPRSNQSRRRPHRDYYTQATRALVAKRFRYEIERFGYTF